VFDLLVKLGANVNSQNKNNEAPIHKAVFNNSIRILLVFPNESVCSGEIRWKLFFNTGQQLIFWAPLEKLLSTMQSDLDERTSCSCWFQTGLIWPLREKTRRPHTN
jgi:ankyrin repeat protein